MDSDEERVLYLTRVGRETVIKRGTYDVRNARPITQDHPFYAYKSLEEGEAYLKSVANRNLDDDDDEEMCGIDMNSDYSDVAGEDSESTADFDASEPENQDPDALANEIMSSNFKVGMSQSEVDDFLKGLLGE